MFLNIMQQILKADDILYIIANNMNPDQSDQG